MDAPRDKRAGEAPEAPWEAPHGSLCVLLVVFQLPWLHVSAEGLHCFLVRVA